MIGEKYAEKKDLLKNLVRLGVCKGLETKAKNHACYFCRKHIEEKMFVFTLNEQNGFSQVYLDKGCYRRAQIFEEHNGISISLN